AKGRERGVARLALDLRVIDLLGLEPRMREARLKRAVVRQHEQALAVVVEPSGGAHPRRARVIGEAGFAVDSRELGEDPKGLVEQQHRGRVAFGRARYQAAAGWPSNTATARPESTYVDSRCTGASLGGRMSSGGGRDVSTSLRHS